MLVKARKQPRNHNTTELAPQPPRVYSYLRFSSPQQAKGNSIARQSEYAREWAAKRGFELDDSLTMRDEGLSAFKGTHIKRGALGVFLEAVEQGLVPQGSVLIVESLDRLSRAEPIIAQNLLTSIVMSGITIVTTGDTPTEYNRETVKQNPGILFMALGTAMRAHEESSTKSDRVRKSYRSKCERWIKGEYRGLVGSPRRIDAQGKVVKGTDPIWVLYSEETKRLELVKEKAETMLRVIELYKAGFGSVEITRRLNAEGMSISDNRPTIRIHKLITYPALKGDKVVVADGKEYTLKGYYPPLMDEPEFEALQLLVGKRVRKGKGEVPAVLTGLKLCRCGYCGEFMSGQTLTTTMADGTKHRNFRRLRCGSYSLRAKECRGGASCTAVPIELAVMRFCANQMNLDHLFSGNDKSNPLMRQLSAKRAALAKTELKLQAIKDEMLNGDGMPSMFREVVRELEANRRTLTQAITKLERELSISSTSRPAPAEEWTRLITGVTALDYDARMKARRLVQETFERIDVFAKGIECDGKNMHVRVTSKRGVVMGFDLDRRTGELIEATKVPSSEKVVEAMRSERKPRSK
ncbi:MAG TPA: recombinase family protein [Paraburkholderia sp.]|uniref:recombinase family protein n=1 Tax=Paraburkholderia sp. TaxID=1926495 RepID=UPI002B462855|nr:recombinase family protein [Paraburkholderia sp.]HKR40082.1 recombinase family protein [Paraburkholderia sp.]